LKCPECPVGAGMLKRKGGNLHFELYKKILKEAKPEIGWLNLYFQGEPFLNSELSEMIKEAKKLKIFTCISTNGHFLDAENCQKLIDSKLSELIISIDGASSLTYSKYRKGGDLKKVQDGVFQLIEKRKKSGSIFPFVSVQFLVFKHNQHEIPQIIKWCKTAKVDRLIFKSAQFYNFYNEDIEPPDIEKYSRYFKNKEGKLEIKKLTKNHCFKLWSSAVFSWDGEFVPCCYDKDLEHSAGNISDNSLIQLWKSDKMHRFRDIIIKNKTLVKICNNCPE